MPTPPHRQTSLFDQASPAAWDLIANPYGSTPGFGEPISTYAQTGGEANFFGQNRLDPNPQGPYEFVPDETGEGDSGSSTAEQILQGVLGIGPTALGVLNDLGALDGIKESLGLGSAAADAASDGGGSLLSGGTPPTPPVKPGIDALTGGGSAAGGASGAAASGAAGAPHVAGGSSSFAAGTGSSPLAASGSGASSPAFGSSLGVGDAGGLSGAGPMAGNFLAHAAIPAAGLGLIGAGAFSASQQQEDPTAGFKWNPDTGRYEVDYFDAGDFSISDEQKQMVRNTLGQASQGAQRPGEGFVFFPRDGSGQPVFGFRDDLAYNQAADVAVPDPASERRPEKTDTRRDLTPENVSSGRTAPTKRSQQKTRTQRDTTPAQVKQQRQDRGQTNDWRDLPAPGHNMDPARARDTTFGDIMRRRQGP